MNKSKFKIGDRVKIINAIVFKELIGTRATVLGASNLLIKLETDGGTKYFNGEHLQLFDDTPLIRLLQKKK